MHRKTALTTTLLLCLCLLPGCAKFTSKRGVDVAWAPSQLNQFKKGETTRQQVLTALGPPSQIIALQSETVLYYLLEKTAGEGLILVVYNRFDINTHYDRAVFFFDEDEVLKEYSATIKPDQEA